MSCLTNLWVSVACSDFLRFSSSQNEGELEQTGWPDGQNGADQYWVAFHFVFFESLEDFKNIEIKATDNAKYEVHHETGVDILLVLNLLLGISVFVCKVGLQSWFATVTIIYNLTVKIYQPELLKLLSKNAQNSLQYA